MKKRIIKILLILLNACLMLVFSFWLMTWIYVHGDEQFLIEYVAKTKNIFLNLENKPPQKDFIFIDIAYDKQLVEKLDSNGFMIGKEAITDRRKLAQFLGILAKKPKNQKFILCDIHFADSVGVNDCEGDSLSPDIPLKEALEKLPNILIPYHLNEKGKAELPIFKKVPRGLSDYRLVGEKFFKFELIVNDSIKTTPLLIYEYLHKTKLKKGFFFHQLGNDWIFNTFMPDFSIRNYDLFKAKEHYKIDNLENILSGLMTEQEILDYVKNRIIIIADFQSSEDTHQSIYGDTAGALILLNAYLTLKNRENSLSGFWLLTLLIFYILASYLVFSKDLSFIQWLKTKSGKKWFKNIIDFLSYTVALIVASIVSFWFFNLPISILYLSIYLFVLKQIVRFTGAKFKLS